MAAAGIDFRVAAATKVATAVRKPKTKSRSAKTATLAQQKEFVAIGPGTGKKGKKGKKKAGSAQD
ncbi:MAG: hypothetical protein ABI564_18155 [Ideonella sp.]